MPEKLKPCPACGAPYPRMVEHEMFAYVACDTIGCCLSGPIAETEEGAANVYASELLVWDCLNTCPQYAHGNEWRWLQQSAYTLSRQLEALDPAVAVRGTAIYTDIAPRDGAFFIPQ